MLRLYTEPAATSCRPIHLFAEESGLDLDLVPVNLFADDHHRPDFAAINPNRAVPVLDHDGFRLTECSAILKYLAELTGSSAYPAELRERARVNRMMDWFITLFSQDFCYGLCYAQVLPEYRRPEPAHSQELAMRQTRAAFRLDVLDQWIGANTFVCGDTITIADHLGASFVSLGELIAFDLSPWPNVARWLGTMQARPSWDVVHAAFYGWRSAVRATAQAPAMAEAA